MVSIQVKHVPDDVHRTLRQRAGSNGQSLQEFLLALLCQEARTPTVNEVLDRAAAQAGASFSLEHAVALIRADRDSR